MKFLEKIGDAGVGRGPRRAPGVGRGAEVIEVASDGREREVDSSKVAAREAVLGVADGERPYRNARACVFARDTVQSSLASGVVYVCVCHNFSQLLIVVNGQT